MDLQKKAGTRLAANLFSYFACRFSTIFFITA